MGSCVTAEGSPSARYSHVLGLAIHSISNLFADNNTPASYATKQGIADVFHCFRCLVKEFSIYAQIISDLVATPRD